MLFALTLHMCVFCKPFGRRGCHRDLFALLERVEHEAIATHHGERRTGDKQRARVRKQRTRGVPPLHRNRLAEVDDVRLEQLRTAADARRHHELVDRLLRQRDVAVRVNFIRAHDPALQIARIRGSLLKSAQWKK